MASKIGAVLIAGIDEVGMGCVAGPVYAAAVVLPADHGIVGERLPC
jgi:ribonuclease HII